MRSGPESHTLVILGSSFHHTKLSSAGSIRHWVLGDLVEKVPFSQAQRVYTLHHGAYYPHDAPMGEAYLARIQTESDSSETKNHS
jgi:hypothetical protein